MQPILLTWEDYYDNALRKKKATYAVWKYIFQYTIKIEIGEKNGDVFRF